MRTEKVMLPFGSTYGTSLGRKIWLKKTLLTGEEKAHIAEAIKSAPTPLSTRVWAAQFGRLPETIRKIATEAGLVLHD